MMSSTNYTSNMVKYHVFVTISFLLAISFDANVYHRFGLMEEGFKEASRIKFSMELVELKAFGNYLESVQLHREGISDTIQAYRYAFAAEYLEEYIFEEEVDIQRLKKEIQEMEQQIEIDTRKSFMSGVSTFRDRGNSIGSILKGMKLAKQAEFENTRSETMMNHAAEEEAQGKKKLAEARDALNMAEATQNVIKLDKGICKWGLSVCNAVRGNNMDGDQNLNKPVLASDEVVKANEDIKSALTMIHNAEVERSTAINLHRSASTHANQSTTLLQDAQVFKDNSIKDLKGAKNYLIKAAEDEATIKQDNESVKQEEKDAELKALKMTEDAELSSYLFERAVSDRNREHVAVERMDRDLKLFTERKTEWEQKIEEATHHVARAGWEALMASVSGLCLFLLVTSNIITTFRYKQPLRWILRESPHFLQDLWYLICHICIFVLAMGYVGELLMVFREQNNKYRAEISIVFALSAAGLHVALLHVLPSLYALFQESRINFGAIRLMIEHVVVKKVPIIVLIYAIEMMVCWYCMGAVIFERVYKLNSHLAWFLVLFVSISYGMYLGSRESAVAESFPTQLGIEYEDPFDSHTNSDGRSCKNDEEKTLLVQGSFENALIDQSINLPSIKSSSASDKLSPVVMKSVSMSDSELRSDDYGSLSDIYRAPLSTSPQNFCLELELMKVRLLVEFWVVSFAVWIACRDVALIRKLSPLATGLVWGRAPLWILNACMFIAFATLIVSFANMNFGRESGLAL